MNLHVYVNWKNIPYLASIEPYHDKVHLLLAELTESEKLLNNGRLKNFSDKTYDFEVTFEIVQVLNSLAPYINWIGENAQMGWSLHINKTKSNIAFYDFLAVFSFASEPEAMHFALRWK